VLFKKRVRLHLAAAFEFDLPRGNEKRCCANTRSHDDGCGIYLRS
jgi:hypothetical protein